MIQAWMESVQAAKLFAMGVASLPLGLVGVAVGSIFTTLLRAIGRNPLARDKIFGIGILGFALTEAVALFALLVVFLLMYPAQGVQPVQCLSAGLATLSLGVVGLAVGKIFTTLIGVVARNPGVREHVFGIGILGFALTEAVAIFSLLVVFLILFLGSTPLDHGKFLGAAVASLPLGVIGWAVGSIFRQLIEQVGRAPENRDKLFGIGILGFALTEAVALFALLVVFLILFTTSTSESTGQMICAGLAALPLAPVGLAVSRIFTTLLRAVGRNPACRDQAFGIGILGFALTEAVALFALLVVFLILFTAPQADSVFRFVGASTASITLGAVGLAVSRIFTTMIDEVGDNPDNRERMFSTGILGFALTEAVALFALLVIFLVMFA